MFCDLSKNRAAAVVDKLRAHFEIGPRLVNWQTTQRNLQIAQNSKNCAILPDYLYFTAIIIKFYNIQYSLLFRTRS